MAPKSTPQAQRPALRLVSSRQASVVEADVMAAWETGSPDFGTLLYDHLIGVMHRTLQSVLGERASEHEDLVQETFEKLLHTLARGSFRRDCSLRSWASVIATRVGLNAIRSRQTQRRYFTQSIDDSGSFFVEPKRSEHGRLEGRSLLRIVRQELSEMAEERSEALVLADVLGHDTKQVAEELGISAAAAQSRVIRGRAELRERLARRGIGPEEEELNS